MSYHYSSSNINHYLDTSAASDKNQYQHGKQSSKLYSSQRLTHEDLPSASTHHQKNDVSATQLYFNLNNSLDGLFSKIQALKEEHVTQVKNPKPIKKMNMDVSNFPMPNLSNNFTQGKPLSVPVFTKPVKKQPQYTYQATQYTPTKPVLNFAFEGQQRPKPALNFVNEDSKAVSPPTQPPFIRSASVNEIHPPSSNFQNYAVEQPLSGKRIPHHHQQQEEQKLLTFSKQTLVKGLLNGGNANMKVSMQVSDPHAYNKRKSNQLELDKIIEKETNETDIIKKSIVFGEPISLKDFELGKNVGSGKFGDVHICRHRATGTLFALKKIFKSTILEYNMITQFTRELKIHYRLDHPNIIKLYTHFQDEYHIFLVMEYAEGGILMDKLKCTEDIASKYVDQTIQALQYLHKLKIAHRDIKPENIVMQFGNTIKLCDFGWASYYENQMKTTFCGTLDYLSPEMKQGGQYDNSVDIWSIGVLTYQLLTGNPPYRKELMLSMKNGIGPSKPGARKVNWSVSYPSYLSPLAQSFIRNLLKQNPDDRATLRFCSTHTFIRKYQQNLEDLLYFQDFNSVLSYNEKKSPQKSGTGGFLNPTWTPTSSSERVTNAFSYAFNNMNI